MTHTPARSVRVPHAVWEAARVRAAADGTTITAVILRALVRYGGYGAPTVDSIAANRAALRNTDRDGQ